MLFDTANKAREALGETWRWPNFSVHELQCRCEGRFCDGEYWHDAEFLDALQRLRQLIGRPLVVNSGHRCAQWNAAVGGAPHSRHKTVAVDISLKNQDREHIRDAAEKLGFTGIGLARSFIHLDRRAVPATWYYKRSRSLWKT